MQDPISDMLIRIKNALARQYVDVTMPTSKMKEAIVKVLKEEGYVTGYSVSEDKKPTLTIELKYYRGKPVINTLKRISSPGLRRYSSCDSLPKIHNGLGTAVISTSQGLMTDRHARSRRLGGEIICEIM